MAQRSFVSARGCERSCLALHRIPSVGGGDGEERLPDARGGGGRRGGRHRGSLRHLRGLQVQNSRNPQGALCGPNHAGECGRLRLVSRSWQFDTLRQKLLGLSAALFVVDSVFIPRLGYVGSGGEVRNAVCLLAALIAT